MQFTSALTVSIGGLAVLWLRHWTCNKNIVSLTLAIHCRVSAWMDDILIFNQSLRSTQPGRTSIE